MDSEIEQQALHEHLSCEFIVTGCCNMVCSYCIAKDLKKQTISIETGQQAIDLFLYLSEGGKSVEFTFSGGEPLLDFSTLKGLVTYADERAQEVGIQAYFVLKTNGTVFNDDIAEFLIRHNVKTVVSIDGPENIHDKHRLFENGNKSHDLVVRNLLSLIKHGIPSVASVTIHPDTSSMVAESVRYLHELGVENIDVGPVYGTSIWNDSDVANLTQSMMDIATYIRHMNNKGRNLEVGPIYRDSEHVDGFLKDSWGCHAGTTNLAFLPSGEIAGCSALAMISSAFPSLLVGDVVSGINQEAIDHLLSHTRAEHEDRSFCEGCQTSINCTGGCLAINYATTGKALVPPAFYCQTIAALSNAWHKAWA